jgi:uncharacterized protein YecE (DUF72 family)
MGRIFIGTSGWSYKEWANDFYHGLKPKEQPPVPTGIFAD